MPPNIAFTNSSDALTGTLSCLGNVGPALGDIGSMGNFNALNGTAYSRETLREALK